MAQRGACFVRRILATLLAAGLSLPATADAVGLSVTPPTIAADYTGMLTLDISGVATGQTVQVEQFVDYNRNGTIDTANPTEPLILSFQATDGQVTTIDGVRNVNVPGDDNAAAGQIRVTLNLQGSAEVSKGIGKSIFKVSAVTGPSFTAQTAVFEMTQTTDSQSVSGQVTSGGSPVPYPYVFLSPVGGGGVAFAVVGNASGSFTLKAPAGTYDLAALKAGFVFDWSAKQTITLTAGGTVNRDVSLAAANRIISGQLTDPTGLVGVPGFQVVAILGDTGPGTVVFTDTNGNFSLPVSTGITAQWGVWFSPRAAAMLGSLAPHGQMIDVTAGNVPGITAQLTKATALIYGSLTKNDPGHTPLPGVEIEAEEENSQSRHQASGVTSSDGSYVIGVIGDTWRVEANLSDSGVTGYLVSSQNTSVSDNHAVQLNFIATPATTHLRGTVKDESNAALSGVEVEACPQQGGSCVYTNTLPDGTFDLWIAGGNWNLGFWNEQLTQMGLIGQNLSLNVIDGHDQNDLTLRVRHANRHITGWVKDGSGNPITDLDLWANAIIDGASYQTNGRTDGAGNYSLVVADGGWSVGVDCYGLSGRGLPCPGNQPVSVPPDRVVNFTVGGATHLRGQVQDNLGTPVTAMDIFAFPQFGGPSVHASLTESGNFDLALSGGMWMVQLDTTHAAQAGLVSPSVQYNVVDGNDQNGLLIVAQRATQQISGSVRDGNQTPIAGITLSANTNIMGFTYLTGTTTDAGGNYVLPVINGYWQVNVSCNDLDVRGFTCPGGQPTDVNNTNPVINFVAQARLQILTTSLPTGTQGIAYLTHLEASGGQPPYSWSLVSSFLPPTLVLAPDGTISGTPVSSGGPYNIQLRVTDSGFQIAETTLPLTINPGLPTATFTITPTLTATATVSPSPTVTPTLGRCVGDCDTSSKVTIDELVHGLAIALGTAPLEQCRSFDVDGNGAVTIDEIVRALQAARNGCAAQSS